MMRRYRVRRSLPAEHSRAEASLIFRNGVAVMRYSETG